MEIINKVKIGNKEYEIILFNRRFGKNEEEVSEIDFENQLIKISTDIPQKMQEQLFLKEILNIAVNETRINFKKHTEEDVIIDLSLALFQIINDNPRLFGKKNKE